MSENKDSILDNLKKNPIIPCTSSPEEIFSPRYDRIGVVLLFDLSIFDLLELSKNNLNRNKHIILNIDTIKGIGTDEYGLAFLKRCLKIDTISTSSPKVINYSKKLNLRVVQTMFIFDSKSLKKGVDLIKTGKPDFVDVRPGILYIKNANFLKNNLKDIPIICSGFIQSKTEVESILENGATAITTSNPNLWEMYL